MTVNPAIWALLGVILGAAIYHYANKLGRR